jgi:MraZ protein
LTDFSLLIKVGKSVSRWVKVADVVFQGPSALALDAKGRLSVPSRHRDALQVLCAGQLTVTKHPDGCLMIFPRPTWGLFRDKVAALPLSAAGWKRVFLGNAVDVEIDSAARLLIAPELRDAAGLDKSVMLLGMGSHFELWDAARYATHEAEVMAGEMPDAIKDFSF